MSISVESVDQGKRGTASSVAILGGSTLGFVAAKSTVFFAPLLLLHSVGVHDYGIYEFAMAWATPLAVLFAVGAGAAVPYFLLKRSYPGFLDIFRLYGVASGFVVLACVALVLSGLLSVPVYLSALVTIIFVMQTIYAALYRSWGQPAMASLAESGNYVVLLAMMLVVMVLRAPAQLGWVAIVYTGYALTIAVHSGYRLNWKRPREQHKRRLRHSISYGLPLIVTGLLTAVLTSSGRLLTGAFFSMDGVGIYAFFLRITSSVILIYQLLNTLLFPKIYKAGVEAIDLYYTGLLTLILAVSLGMFFLGPYVFGPFFPMIRNIHGEYRSIFFVFTFQMVFWAATAMLELVINRENMAKYFITVLLGTVTFLIGGILLMKHLGILTLLRLCQLNMTSIFLCFASQWFLLRRKGVRLRVLPSLAGAIYAGYLLTMHWAV